MKAYKLTNSNNQTYKSTKWGKNITHTVRGKCRALCSNGWIHFYQDPLIAVLMNPVCALFHPPKLWECETAGKHKHEPLMSGCKTLTTTKQIPLPKVTTTQRVAFAILCAKEQHKDSDWNLWADNWLQDKTRSTDDAVAALQHCAFWEPNWYAVLAAYAAAMSTKLPVTYRDDETAEHAAYAALYISGVNPSIDFVALVNEAMKY